MIWTETGEEWRKRKRELVRTDVFFRSGHLVTRASDHRREEGLKKPASCKKEDNTANLIPNCAASHNS